MINVVIIIESGFSKHYYTYIPFFIEIFAAQFFQEVYLHIAVRKLY
jgi:hypothetical protein